MSWDDVYKNRGKFFQKPHPSVVSFAKFLRDQGVKNILDIGCGTGRHPVFLSKLGFNVSGFDISPTGLKLTKIWLKKENLDADIRVLEMDKKYPYKDGCFDAIISIKTLHHNNPNRLKRSILEVSRVLRKGGYVFIIVPKTMTQGNNFKKVDFRTFVPLDGIEKGVPHFYFNKKLIKAFFHDFKIIKMDMEIETKKEKGFDIVHYAFVGVKK